jgi:hypothetical protein
MRDRKFLPVVLFAAMFFSFATNAATAASQSGGLLLRMEQIRDPQMGNVPAAAVALPEGWKLTKGEVLWNFSMISDPAHVLIEARNPADDAYFGMISKILYAYGQYMSPEFGMIIKQPMSPEDYIRELLNNDRDISDVRVTKITKPQAAAEALAKYASGLEKLNIEEAIRRGLRNAGSQRVTSDVALLEYTCSKNGRRYEGAMMVGILYTQWPDSVVWHTTPLTAVYAYEGKFAAYERDLAAILGNSSINPAWEEVRGQVTNYLQQQKIRAQEAQIRMQDAALQRQIQDTYDHISKTRRETFASRQDSMSRVSQGWTNAITGTDTWSGGGESYSAPTGYGYGWAKPDGTTYYTNDSTFNPNHSSNFSGDWSQMEKTPW